MAPADNLSPAGSSTYASSTLFVGDGTWDASKNDFLLPNLMGLNFDTMRYNGMGNRFSTMPGYYGLILAHAVLAVITFLFIVPMAIFVARFYGRSPGWALRWHIYLQILTVGLTTVLFVLGWFAVGTSRSLTNPHHGIGLAIYVLVMVQALSGWWIHKRERGRARRKIPVRLVLHQWIGRSTALLAIAQVPLGLTLYGSPEWTFIVYALWIAFLVVWYFVLSYRAMIPFGGYGVESSHGGTVISDRRSGRLGGILMGGRQRSRSRGVSRSRRDEVLPSHTGSGSYVEEEKFESGRKREGGSMMKRIVEGAAFLGAGAIAKNWYEKRQQRRDDVTEYSSVAPDTPSRKQSRRHDRNESVLSDESRLEQGRRPRTPLLPGPGDPVATAAALSAAEAAPTTPRPTRTHSHTHSQSGMYSDDYSYYGSELSPSQKKQGSDGLGKGILPRIGLGWFAKKMRDRKEKKEQDRQDRIDQEQLDMERQNRQSGSRYTGDGPRRTRPTYSVAESELSSVLDNPHTFQPGASIPPIPAALAGGAAGADLRPRHDITEPVAMPPAPPDPQGILHSESGSEAYISNGGHPHRRPSERRRRANEIAAAEAAAAATALANAEEARRQRSRSRAGADQVAPPPVSVKVKVHGDKDRNITLRRLTEAEAAAERASRGGSRERRKRAESLSSLSGTDTAAGNHRYRRSERAAERKAEQMVEENHPPPPMTHLSPPNPAFAAGRRPKDSAYYSTRPGEASAAGGETSVASTDSHGTWSEMSPSRADMSDTTAAAEKRRRRRAERNRVPAGSGTVEFN